MEKFLIILAWILAIPTTFYVLWCLMLFIVVLFSKGAKIEVGAKAIIPYIIFALSWAWILSR